jgi:hypothetical protein
MIAEITLTVLRASVLLRMGTDQVTLQVDKPSPFPPDVDPDPLRISFEVRANHGVAYCREHFGIDPEVINARSR